MIFTSMILILLIDLFIKMTAVLTYLSVCAYVYLSIYPSLSLCLPHKKLSRAYPRVLSTWRPQCLCVSFTQATATRCQAIGAPTSRKTGGPSYSHVRRGVADDLEATCKPWTADLDFLMGSFPVLHRDAHFDPLSA